MKAQIPGLGQEGRLRTDPNPADSRDSCLGSLWGGQKSADLDSRDLTGCLSPMYLEIVRAMTYVINQGLALYWGTSQWGAAEIMVSLPLYFLLPFFHMATWNALLGEGNRKT